MAISPDHGKNRIDPAEQEIDRILGEALARGENGAYIDIHQLGQDSEAMIKKYERKGWIVEYVDKADSYLFSKPEKLEDFDFH